MRGRRQKAVGSRQKAEARLVERRKAGDPFGFASFAELCDFARNKEMVRAKSQGRKARQKEELQVGKLSAVRRLTITGGVLHNSFAATLRFILIVDEFDDTPLIIFHKGDL